MGLDRLVPVRGRVRSHSGCAVVDYIGRPCRPSCAIKNHGASILRPEEGEKSMLDIKIGFVIEGKEVPVDSLVEALVREIPSSAREKIRARISKLRVA